MVAGILTEFVQDTAVGIYFMIQVVFYAIA